MSLSNIARMCAVTGLLWLSGPARSDVFVVAAASSTFQSISAKDLQALYMGRRQETKDGNPVQATDLPRDHPLRQQFYARLTGMTAAQVNSHWSRLLFSGRSTPPVILSNPEAVFGFLLRTPNTLGYTSSPPTPASGLKVVMVLRTSLDNPQGHAP